MHAEKIGTGTHRPDMIFPIGSSDRSAFEPRTRSVLCWTRERGSPLEAIGSWPRRLLSRASMPR